MRPVTKTLNAVERTLIRSQLAAIIATVVAAACSPPSNESRVPRHTALGDSAYAVSIAIAAYQAERGRDTLPVGPTQFERDSAGLLIYLAPVDKRIQGGGALVRVGADGRAKVLKRSQ